LQDINIEEYRKNPLTCDCSHSPFQYNPLTASWSLNTDLGRLLTQFLSL
jgi:hypothetical protein